MDSQHLYNRFYFMPSLVVGKCFLELALDLECLMDKNGAGSPGPLLFEAFSSKLVFSTN